MLDRSQGDAEIFFFYCKIARKRARGPTGAPGFIVRGRESEASEEEAGGAKAV